MAGTGHRPRRRAPSMSIEERRAAIVESTIPLLLEHGGNVRTSQIAAAADIAEGTVFRAFKDKQELLLACLHTGLECDDEVAGIARIDRDLPFEDQLIRAVEIVTGYLERMWTLVQALTAAGIQREDIHKDVHGKGESECPEGEGVRPRTMRQLARLGAAVTELFEANADELRVGPERAAHALHGLVLTNRMQGQAFGEGVVSKPHELVDLFLYGVHASGERRR